MTRVRAYPCRAPASRCTGRHRQRGVAALAATLLLLGLLALAVAYSGRHVLTEQKTIVNQLRAAQAFDAAEAGIDWAVAMLAVGRTIGDDCLATPGTVTLRERMLSHDPSSGRILPRTWTAPGGAELPLRMACVATGTGGWDCRCPASGAALPALPDAADATVRPAFSVAFTALPRAGSVQLTAFGCDHASRSCLETGSADDGRAVARVQVALALLPAVVTPPVAALTARGSVATGAGLIAASTDPSAGGIAVHAGGSFVPGASLQSAPGAPASAASVGNDATLASTTADALFAAVSGVDRARWRQLPGMLEVACADPCDAALAASLAGAAAPTFVHIAGDLRLAGSVALGSAARPVVLVVDGSLQLAAGSVVHGLAYVGADVWNTTGSTGGLVRGAVVAQGSVVGDGALVVFRDADVLTRLHGTAGVLVPVPGSWRDYCSRALRAPAPPHAARWHPTSLEPCWARGRNGPRDRFPALTPPSPCPQIYPPPPPRPVASVAHRSSRHSSPPWYSRWGCWQRRGRSRICAPATSRHASAAKPCGSPRPTSSDCAPSRASTLEPTVAATTPSRTEGRWSRRRAAAPPTLWHAR